MVSLHKVPSGGRLIIFASSLSEKRFLYGETTRHPLHFEMNPLEGHVPPGCTEKRERDRDCSKWRREIELRVSFLQTIPFLFVFGCLIEGATVNRNLRCRKRFSF